MFFLISYGLLNYATYYEARTSSPSFRPTFRWFDQRLSLVGFLACIGVMLAIDPTMGIVAVAIIFAIFQYLRRTADPARWADSRRAHHLQRVRENLLAATISPEHPRDWRPQLLAFTEDAERRPRLLKMSGWLEGGSGLTTIVKILEGKDLLLSGKKDEEEKRLRVDISAYNPSAFPLVLTTKDIDVAIHALLQAHGIGPLRANTVLVNWLDPDNDSGMGFRELLFGRQLRTLYALGCNILIFHAQPDSWARLIETQADQSRIDVWWSHDETGHLMLLFAYLMTRSEAWQGSTLRVLVFKEDAGGLDNEEDIQAVLKDARIEADIVWVASNDPTEAIKLSAQSTLIFLPFRFHGNLIQLPIASPAEDLLQKLPPALMILAAEDIDLGAEPEEGIAAEMAEARDELKKREQLAETAQKSAEAADEAAKDAEEKLQDAMRLPEGDRDQNEITILTEQLNSALETAEKARRKAIKARVKAEHTQKALGNGDSDVKIDTEKEKS